MLTRTAYICEYCNTHKPMKKTVYLTKEICWAHEQAECLYNPSLRGCMTCQYHYYDEGVNKCTIQVNPNQKEEEGGRFLRNRGLIKNCKSWESKEEVTNEHI